MNFIKAETVEQYFILDYLKKNITINYFKIELIDRNTVKLIDKNGETLFFKYNKEIQMIECF